MKNIIEIDNLNFTYDSKEIFKNLNLNIIENSFTTVIGSNGCGKSTLAKLLVGLLENNSTITINNKILNNKNKKSLRNIIGYLPENPDNLILMDTVEDEFKINNIEEEELTKLIQDLSVDKILKLNPRDLSGGEKQIISFISQVIKKPKILIIDEAFSMVDNKIKDKIYKILKKLNKTTTIINFTNDIEDTLYGDYITIIDNKTIIINDKKEEILPKEKLLKKLNLNIPFIVDVSLKLKYYDLINKVEWDIDKLVNKLWK